MGWWEELTSWVDFRGKVERAIKESLDYVKSLLWGWVDDIAKFWVKQANTFFDILNHTWEDVLDAVEEAKDWATDLSCDVLNQLDALYNEFGRSLEQLWINIKPFVSEFMSGLQSVVDDIRNVKIPSLEDITNWTKEQLDNILHTDIPILNQSVMDLWNEAGKIWDFVWSVPDNIWNALREGGEGIMSLLVEKGEAFIEHILRIDLPVEDLVEELWNEVGGRKK